MTDSAALLTFFALPFLSGFLSADFLRRTAVAIFFLPPEDLRLAALLLLKHFGLPSPGLRSPHLPIRSPFVLYLSQPPPPAPPSLPLPNQSRRFSSNCSSVMSVILSLDFFLFLTQLGYRLPNMVFMPSLRYPFQQASNISRYLIFCSCCPSLQRRLFYT